MARLCPTGALSAAGADVEVRPHRCIACYRCVRGPARGMEVGGGHEIVTPPVGGSAVTTMGPPRSFRASLNILVVDAGDCGACLNEVRQLNNPYYNIHRLGFFISPTPRNADVLLVVGVVTDAMRHPLRAAWEAMPGPKYVLATGTCALTGSVFGPSFTCGAGAGSILPVDLEVPGSPPSPLAIIHALLVLSGRASMAASADGHTR
jgi:formate hydrogenlyase subunit 7